jgi:hypothetical protein
MSSQKPDLWLSTALAALMNASGGWNSELSFVNVTSTQLSNFISLFVYLSLQIYPSSLFQNSTALNCL